MLNEQSIKQVIASLVVAVLLVFAFFIIKPIFFAIILGLILAYSFSPVNAIILKRVKNRTLSAAITCITSLGIIVVLMWFLLPTLINQSFEAYMTIQKTDIVGFLKTSFPFLFSNPQVAANLEAAYSTFLSTTVNTALSKFTSVIVDLPSFALKTMIVLILFFYGLRDGDKLIEIIRNSLPFSKRVTNKFIDKSRQVTFSVIFGRVIVGIATGILTGIGFYVVGTKGALLLTFLAIIASIIPLIGPWIVWVPVVIGLLVTDQVWQAVFLLLYGGVIINLFENILHPLFVSKTSKIPTSLTLIGVIGGLLVFGIFGLILGPLIMAYLLILFELYSEKSAITEESKSE